MRTSPAGRAQGLRASGRGRLLPALDFQTDRHSRESGNLDGPGLPAPLDSRFRGNDDWEMAGRPAPAGKGLSQMKPEVLWRIAAHAVGHGSAGGTLRGCTSCGRRRTGRRCWRRSRRRCGELPTDGHAGASAELMAALPKLEIVGCYGVGVDSIDLGYAKEHGVVVTNTPGVLTDDVADMAIALLLDVCRGISAGDRYIRTGHWLQGPMPLTRRPEGQECRHSRGSAASAGRSPSGAAIFGCGLSYHGPREKPDAPYPYYPDLTEMAAACDFVGRGPAPADRRPPGSVNRAGPRRRSARRAGWSISRAARWSTSRALVAALQGRPAGVRGAGRLRRRTERARRPAGHGERGPPAAYGQRHPWKPGPRWGNW